MNINIKALEQFLSDSFYELESHAVKDMSKDQEYQKLTKEMRKIGKKHAVIPYLYEGNKLANGHTLTEGEVRAFKKYYETARDREGIIQRQLFCYGVVMGSNLADKFTL